MENIKVLVLQLKGRRKNMGRPVAANTTLDVVLTGKMINSIIKKNKYSIKELQKVLNLSCPQPIYRWIRGETLPSIDNLYMMSKIFEVHMEDMLVARNVCIKNNK